MKLFNATTGEIFPKTEEERKEIAKNWDELFVNPLAPISSNSEPLNKQAS